MGDLWDCYNIPIVLVFLWMGMMGCMGIICDLVRLW